MNGLNMVWRKRGTNMGKMNTITKDYMSEPKYFADSFNYYLFDGRQVIKADDLQVLDPTEMILVPKETKIENVEKIRDVLKQCVLMADERATYLMLGIENQTDIHYALPVKNMIYDALNYGKQVSDKAKEHRKKKDLRTSGEFLSGFSKEDKLKPLITLTIYFGAEDWDAPRSLKEMFETTDDTILQFVEDYRVHLIVPNEIRDFNKFTTDFGKVKKYEFNPEFVVNTEKLSKGLVGFNEWSEPEWSKRELAQMNKYWDNETKSWSEQTVNEAGATGLLTGKSLMYATYDEDG